MPHTILSFTTKEILYTITEHAITDTSNCSSYNSTYFIANTCIIYIANLSYHMYIDIGIQCIVLEMIGGLSLARAIIEPSEFRLLYYIARLTITVLH